MGVKWLKDFIKKEAPKAHKSSRLATYSGKRIAVDTTIWMYTFLNTGGVGGLRNPQNEPTGHIRGILERTANGLEAGMKLIHVLDGTPPYLKTKHTMPQRQQKSERDKTDGISLKRPTGWEVSRKVGPSFSSSGSDYHRQPVPKSNEDQGVLRQKPSPKQYEDCERICQLTGLPVIKAPGEAEAQCAYLCKKHDTFAIVSTDSDCLAFGANYLVGTFNNNDKEQLTEYNFEKVLQGLKISHDQLIDVYILAGCDYCAKVEGMNVEKAFDLIREHGSINAIVDTHRDIVPQDWEEARELFKNPTVDHDVNLAWTQVNAEGLRKFLIDENNFSSGWVDKIIMRINKTKKRTRTLDNIPGWTLTKNPRK